MKKLAIATFAIAVTLVPSALICQTSLNSTTTVVPPQLKPHSAVITLHMTDDAKAVYQAVGKVAGINVLFDANYTSRQVQVDFDSTNLNDSLHILGQLTGTFYKVLTPNTIFVTFDSRQRHNDLDVLIDRTFYLKNTYSPAESNEIVTALRNMLPPEAKIILVPTDDAIVSRSTPENIALAQQLLNDLDLPVTAYRLTYTVTEADGNKPVGTQHFAMNIVSGQQTKLKQGTKIPITTGSYNAVATTGEHAAPAGLQTQVTYLDIGMNFDSVLTATATGGLLKFDIEQSSLAPEASGVGPQDPIIRQTSLSGDATLFPGKPAMLGSIDIPGSTRRLDIEVVMDPIR